MTKRSRPAVDRLIVPAHGISRDGQPLSYNRAPAPDLAPWIGRFYAMKVDTPPDYHLRCGVFNDTSMVHVQLAGAWTAEMRGGSHASRSETLFMGPHTRLMPVSVRGSFMSVGYFLRPGAAALLAGLRLADWLDMVAPVGALGPPPVWSMCHFDPGARPEEWVATIEQALRSWLAEADRQRPDEITRRFENAAFADPSISVAEVACGIGIGERTLERIVRRDFGLSPKQVLRRARALDMASHLRGVADAAEAEVLALRYYDQSHLIRDFTELFGMSPRQFVATPQPLLTMGLELRQARRLEAIERLAPGAVRPWNETAPPLSGT